MAALIPVSGLGAKGPACFVVEAAGARLMLDLGYGPQPGLWPDVSTVGRVDAVLLSHAHRDHAGGLELLSRIGSPPLYATDIVRRLICADAASILPLKGTTEVCGLRVTTGRSGHAPGGIWLHLDAGDGLLYTGDSSVESVVYMHDSPPAAGTLLLDASYGTYDTALADALPAFDGLFSAGPVLMPVPAAGRAADIALHVLRGGRGFPHIDNAVRVAFAELGADNGASVRPEAAAELASIARDAPAIDRAEGVMLATVADGTAGEAARLIARWEHEREPAIVFTGYVPPGTPAERLTRAGRARHLRWNVHLRLSDAVDLVRHTGAHTVLPAFGDARHLAQWQSAFRPARVALKGPVTL